MILCNTTVTRNTRLFACLFFRERARKEQGEAPTIVDSCGVALQRSIFRGQLKRSHGRRSRSPYTSSSSLAMIPVQLEEGNTNMLIAKL